MKKSTTVLLAAGLAVGIMGVAFAQGPGDGDGRFTPAKAEAMRAKQVARLQEKLDLDDATTAKVSAVFRKYDEQRMQIGPALRKDMESLKALMKSEKPDEKELKPILDRLSDGHLKMQALMNQQAAEVRTLLTPTQQAKFVLQMNKFRDHFKGKAPRGHGPEMGPPPPDDDD